MAHTLSQSNKSEDTDLPSGENGDLYFHRRDYLINSSQQTIGNARKSSGWIIPDSDCAIVPLPQSETVPATTLPGRFHILMAEDSKEQQVFVRFLLKNTAYTVDFADNGLEAVSRFKEGRYDLVFMDMRMPKMDGLEATRQIREWESHRSDLPVPIVALTGMSGKNEIDKCRAAGCTDHLAKPFSQKDFFKKLE